MKASKRQIAEVNVRVENSVSGIRETKSYVAEHIETERFTHENALFVKIRSGAMKALGRFEAVMQFSTDILYLVIIFIGGMFLYYKKIDAGDFAAFILYISMFMTPIQRFVALFQQLQEGMAGFSRFTEIMALDGEVDEGRVEISDVKGEIKFESVSFGYGEPSDTKRMVISDFSLTVNAGETVALVGPSGGGKTTVCSLIPRFYNIDSGRILLDGIDISDITLRSLRRNIGTVSQSVVIFAGTLRDNIAYGTDGASDEEIIEAAKLANIHDFIMTLPQGYDTEVGERGVKLSGGQRQRVAIARMFMKNPKLLILDEATSALDNATEMLIQESLEKLSSGRTVLVVAHRLSTVKGADKIVVLDEHGIVESGTHEELIARDGEYKKLYSYQFKQ
jgi:ATP-binding cassette subfamily B protein